MRGTQIGSDQRESGPGDNDAGNRLNDGSDQVEYPKVGKRGISFPINQSEHGCLHQLVGTESEISSDIIMTYALIITTPSIASWYKVIKGDPATAINLLNSALTLPRTPESQ